MPHEPDFPPAPAPAPPVQYSISLQPGFTEERAEAICAATLRDGLGAEIASAVCGVPGPVVQQWKMRHPLFAAQLEQARAEFQRARLATIREVRARDGSYDWRAQAYLAEKAHLAGAADPEEQPAGEATLSPLLVIPPEQLALLQQRRLAALAKMNP